MSDHVPVLTLDGPSGVGKGTICLRVAGELGWHILDSGSLYRLTALTAKRNSSLKNTQQLIEIAGNLDISYTAENERLKISLGAEDVTEAIRAEDVGVMASRIAAIPELREALLDRQKAFATAPGLVADGRDMGSVVFPHAELKIFLTASPEERAKRRYKQLKDKGIDANLPELVIELEERDRRDSTREVSPLVAAEDAVTIDTTDLGIEEVFSEVMHLVKSRFE
jgi:cytidylate kinase